MPEKKVKYMKSSTLKKSGSDTTIALPRYVEEEGLRYYLKDLNMPELHSIIKRSRIKEDVLLCELEKISKGIPVTEHYYLSNEHVKEALLNKLGKCSYLGHRNGYVPLDNEINPILFREMDTYSDFLYKSQSDLSLVYTISYNKDANKYFIKINDSTYLTINLDDPKTWYTLKIFEQCKPKKDDKDARRQDVIIIFNHILNLLDTVCSLHFKDNNNSLKFQLVNKNTINAYDGFKEALTKLEAAYKAKSAKPSILPHTLLPSAVVLSAIFVSTGVIAMPVFSIALMTASALGALALQVAIYQNNTQNKGGMLQNPWVSHNTLAFGLALIAYLSLMTNPLAALIAVSTIMTLAPLASVMSQSLFAGNDADTNLEKYKLVN